MLTLVAEKYLLALKCLLAAAALDKDHPMVHEQIIRFKLAIDKDIEFLAPKSVECIKSEFTLLPASIDLVEYNDKYLAKNKSSARHVVSALKVRKLISPDAAKNCERDIAGVISRTDISLVEAQHVLDVLKSWRSGEVDGFKSKAKAKWPKSSVFATT